MSLFLLLGSIHNRFQFFAPAAKQPVLNRLAAPATESGESEGPDLLGAAAKIKAE
jgi:hypothetical protein